MTARKSRIALLGNMNNNFFNLSRFLRDLDYDADLFIFPSDPLHFQPESDSFTDDHKAFVRRLEWGNPFDLRSTSVKKIKEDLTDYDFFIACGSAPAYLAKAGIDVDLFIPYGYDLYNWPFFKLVNPKSLWDYFVFTRYQQKGIRKSRNISIADNSPVFQRALARIGFSGNRLYSGIPMVYTGQYTSEKIASYFPYSEYYREFSRIRQQFDLIIFHNSRHAWKTEDDPISLKDNDKLFRGLSSYLKGSNPQKVAIVTFEYGKDVMASKRLITDLGLQESVFWFPLLPRKEVMVGMSLSDIVAGEFRNSWFTYGVVFESMALAKPIMHFRDDRMYPGLTLYPMLHAKEASDITEILKDYSFEKNKLQAIGRSANEWFVENTISKSLKDIQSILER